MKTQRKETVIVGFIGLILSLIPISGIPAQVVTGGSEPRYPGTTGELVPYDTAAIRDIRTRTVESVGLIEQPIDPDVYMVGPNDVFTVSIPVARLGSVPMQYDVVISPDARLVLPGIGDIDVRGKTLNQTRAVVRSVAGRIYKGDVSVSLRKMRQFKVNVIGEVRSPGAVAATPTTRVSEVIDLAIASTVASKRNVVLIRAGKRISVDLQPFYSYGDLRSNPTVEGGDVVSVGVQDKSSIVAVFGAVHRPGEFGFHEGDSVSSMIRYALGFTADAFLDSIEVVSVGLNGDIINRTIFSAAADGTVRNDRPILTGDRVFVRSIPKYKSTSRVILTGEVKYPNNYPIARNGTRLREVIEQAGGFTSDASYSDAVLVRQKEVVRDPELERIFQIDPKERTKEETEYFRVKTRERSGVMSVDFEKLMKGDERENIELIDKDSLFVPAKRAFIKVSGKVKTPGNLIYENGKGYIDYINSAGGFGWRADDDDTRIVKSRTGETFLASNVGDYQLEPGDQIFVPEKPPGNFWSGFATGLTVFAQLSTIVAVVVSITK